MTSRLIRSLCLRSVCFLALLAPALIAGEFADTSFPLEYHSMIDRGDVTPVDQCVQVSVGRFVDARGRGNEGGARTHEKRSGVTRKVALTNDPARWLKDGANEMFREALVTSGEPGRPVVEITLRELWLTEVVYRRAEYDGRVVLDVALKEPETEKVLWSHRLSGFAENYGYAGSAVNYQETINHALGRALLDLLNSKEFAAAACGATATVE